MGDRTRGEAADPQYSGHDISIRQFDSDETEEDGDMQESLCIAKCDRAAADPDATEDDEDMQEELYQANLARQRESRLLQISKKRSDTVDRRCWAPQKKVRTWSPTHEPSSHQPNDRPEGRVLVDDRGSTYLQIKKGWAPKKKYTFTPRHKDEGYEADDEKNWLPVMRLFMPQAKKTRLPPKGWFSTQHIVCSGHSSPQAW